MEIEQRHYGPKAMLLVLAFLSAFPPLTTDIYLPALPTLVEQFETTRSLVNLTLSLFFLSYACGLLFWGPLSEKYGRKPILYTGLVIYVLASILCAKTNSIDDLIIARILQGFGGAATTAIATALVKDIYDGSRRARILATIMSIVIIAPIVAPIIGAQILKVATWQMLFYALALVGVMALGFAFFITETVNEKSDLSIARSLLRPFVLIKKPSISLLLLLFSSTSLPLMAYLASASFIYSKVFDLSEQEFSFFFAFNALCAILGPAIYIRASNYFSTQKIITAGFCGITIGSLVTLTVGHISPYIFALGAALMTISVIAIRPPGTNLVLEQHDRDTGSLSSLINFSSTVVGTLGMTMISIEGLDQIYGLGFIGCGVGIIGVIAWQILQKKELFILPK